jgi:hypothetical protein
MKVKVHTISELKSPVMGNTFQGDLIAYSIDEKGHLSIGVQDVNGNEENGAIFASGSWLAVEQIEGPRPDILAAARARQEEAEKARQLGRYRPR